MLINVTYDETDIAKALGKIIKDSNAEEFVKLLTPILATNPKSTDLFFKLMLGNKLYEPLSKGTLCKMPVQDLGFGASKENIRKTLADKEDKVIVRVDEFRGYHDYGEYKVLYVNVTNDGNQLEDFTYINKEKLEVIEEF